LPPLLREWDDRFQALEGASWRARRSVVLKDIREFKNDQAAYAEELERRWTGLLSYRYIGRNHGSMNTGPADNTVTLRRDMRNAAGGLLVGPARTVRRAGLAGCRPAHRSPAHRP
jgi:hypothetical protein